MEDLELAVQLCLPLEWAGPFGSTMNEFQLRELLAYAKFMDEAPTFEYNWKDIMDKVPTQIVELIKKQIRLADCVDQLLEDDLEV